MPFKARVAIQDHTASLLRGVPASEGATRAWDLGLTSFPTELVKAPSQVRNSVLSQLGAGQVVINNKRGGGFKKAKGKGSVVLKCEAPNVQTMSESQP